MARIGIFFTKLSILLFLQRVFVPPHSKKTVIFYSIWAVIWFNLAYCIALVLTVLLECVGKDQARGATCVNTYMLLIGASTINVFSDLLILLIPIFAVWKLHMSTRRKVGLSFVFAVGIL